MFQNIILSDTKKLVNVYNEPSMPMNNTKYRSKMEEDIEILLKTLNQLLIKKMFLKLEFILLSRL